MYIIHICTCMYVICIYMNVHHTYMYMYVLVICIYTYVHHIEYPKLSESIITLSFCIYFLQAAHSGAKSTKTMDAKAGRASNVDSSLVTQVDPGAKAVAIWLEAVLNGLK